MATVCLRFGKLFRVMTGVLPRQAQSGFLCEANATPPGRTAKRIPVATLPLFCVALAGREANDFPLRSAWHSKLTPEWWNLHFAAGESKLLHMSPGEISQANPHDKSPGCIESAKSPFGETRSPTEESISSRSKPLVVTPVLVGLCVLVFVFMILFKISPIRPSTEQLLHWGANFGPLTLAGQWWRLLSSVFLHIGIFHLAVNIWCLWNLGELAERIYGRAVFLGFYLTAGVAGAIVSLAWHPFAVSAGASGAVFGVAGALIVTFWFGDVPFPRRHIQITLASLLAFAGYNLLFGFITPGIGNAAHIGGLLAGLALGYLLQIGRRATVVITLIALYFFGSCQRLCCARGARAAGIGFWENRHGPR